MWNRAFISSTVHDLGDIRDEVVRYLDSLGISSIASEKGLIHVTPGVHSYDVCLGDVQDADFVLCFIGGRYGGTLPAPESDISITRAEFRKARELKKPAFVFVRQNVLDAKELAKAYGAFKPSKIVDDARIFDFIDEVRKSATDNWFFQFNAGGDVIAALRRQLEQFGMSEFMGAVSGTRGLPIRELPRGSLQQVVDMQRHWAADVESHFFWVVMARNPGVRQARVVIEARFDMPPTGWELFFEAMANYPPGQQGLHGKDLRFDCTLMAEQRIWVMVKSPAPFVVEGVRIRSLNH